MHGVNMKVNVKREELLNKLRANRERHAAIVVEAREGYVKSARVEVERRLERLREGKIVALDFHLQVPEDYTSAYDTVIGMLSMSEQSEIEIDAKQYRMFVEDEWEWLHAFLVTSSNYSGLSRSYAETKNISSEG